MKLSGEPRRIERLLAAHQRLMAAKPSQRAQKRALAAKWLGVPLNRERLARAIAACFASGHVRPDAKGRHCIIRLKFLDIFNQLVWMGVPDVAKSLSSLQIWTYVVEWAEMVDNRNVDAVVDAYHERQNAWKSLPDGERARRTAIGQARLDSVNRILAQKRPKLKACKNVLVHSSDPQIVEAYRRMGHAPPKDTMILWSRLE